MRSCPLTLSQFARRSGSRLSSPDHSEVATVALVHVEPLAIAGVYRATSRKKGDRRFDWFRSSALQAALPPDWVPSVGTMIEQQAGRIEGLLLQDDHVALTCAAGKAALAVLDARIGSATFGRWIPQDLDTFDRVTVIVPPGCAWGFQAFTRTTLITVHRGLIPSVVINPRDPWLQIAWPLPDPGVSTDEPPLPGLNDAAKAGLLPRDSG